MRADPTLEWKMLHELHKYIEKALDPLRKYCFEGFSATTKCGSRPEAYFVVVPYIADLSEAKDVLEINRDVGISYPCPSCYTDRDNFRNYTSAALRFEISKKCFTRIVKR